MTSQVLNLTFGKTKLKAFIRILIATVDQAYNDPVYTDDGVTDTWKKTWKNWLDRGLASADTRNKIVQILFDGKTNTKDVTEVMYQFITKLRENIPPVSRSFTFEQNEDDPEVWKVIVMSDTTTSASEEPWLQVPSKIRGTTTSNIHSTPPLSSAISTNPFAALQDDFDAEMDQRHKDLTSIPEEIEESEPENKNSPSSSGISFDDSTSVDNKPTYYFSDELRNSNAFYISQEEIDRVCNDILTKNENIDTDLHYKWIISSATAMDSRILQQHVQLVEHDNKLLKLEPVINTLKTEHEDLVKNAAAQIADPILGMVDEVSKTITEFDTKLKKLKNESHATAREVTKQLAKVKSTITSDESRAILQINTAYNACKVELDEKLAEGNTIIHGINNLKTVLGEAQQTVEQIKHRTDVIVKQTIDKFEEELQAKCDEEREQLRSWMESRKVINFPDQLIMQDVQNERDKLIAEKHLLQKLRHDISKWYEEVKLNISTMQSTSHNTPTPTTSNINAIPSPEHQHSTTFTASDGTTINNPLPPDTFVHYCYKLSIP